MLLVVLFDYFFVVLTLCACVEYDKLAYLITLMFAKLYLIFVLDAVAL